MLCKKCKEVEAADLLVSITGEQCAGWCKKCMSQEYFKIVEPIRANRAKKWDAGREKEPGEYRCSKCELLRASLEYSPSALANRMMGVRAMCHACSAACMRAYRKRKADSKLPEDYSDLC